MVGMKQEYTIADAVEWTDYSDSTIRRAIKNGELKAELQPGPKGQEYRITKEELEKWLVARGQDRPMASQDTDGGQPRQEVGLVPYQEVKVLEERLQSTLFRAGQAEGKVEILEMNQESLLQRLTELEAKYEEAMARNEQRDERIVELITEWREQGRRPFWKKWFGLK